MNLTDIQPNESGPKVFALDAEQCTKRQLEDAEAGKFAGPNCFVCRQTIKEGDAYYWIKALTEDEKRRQLQAEGVIKSATAVNGRVIRGTKSL